MSRIFALGLCSLALLSCAPEEQVKTTNEVAQSSSASVAMGHDLSDIERGKVCRAAIAVTMGRNVEIVRVDRIDTAMAYVSYVRQDDGVPWAFRCRYDGSQVIWSAIDGSRAGRWRDEPEDGTLTYTVSGGTVSITEMHADGSSQLHILNVPD